MCAREYACSATLPTWAIGSPLDPVVSPETMRKPLSTRAERGDSGFTTGFIMGGVVFGALGFLFAPQVGRGGRTSAAPVAPAAPRQAAESERPCPAAAAPQPPAPRRRHSLSRRMRLVIALAGAAAAATHARRSPPRLASTARRRRSAARCWVTTPGCGCRVLWRRRHQRTPRPPSRSSLTRLHRCLRGV
jgi:hypothetical protein